MTEESDGDGDEDVGDVQASLVDQQAQQRRSGSGNKVD